MGFSVLFFCGGVSPEHSVSVSSVRSLLQHVDYQKYQCTLIGVSQRGDWFFIPHQNGRIPPGDYVEEMVSASEGKAVEVEWYKGKAGKFLCFFAGLIHIFDCVFPMIHGATGEDGCIQGLLSMTGVPFVGSSVLGSSLGMDKEFSRKILQVAGLLVPKYRVFTKNSWKQTEYKDLVAYLGEGLFVKPVQGGSSLGVSQVYDMGAWEEAMVEAFGYGDKVLCEQWISGNELSCAVLESASGELLCASIGEIKILAGKFYDYEAKYCVHNKGVAIDLWDGSGAMQEYVKGVALKACAELSISGYARVDGFFQEERFFVNEVNTIPGFTETSLFPKLWRESGLSMSQLIDALISVARPGQYMWSALEERRGKCRV